MRQSTQSLGVGVFVLFATLSAASAQSGDLGWRRIDVHGSSTQYPSAVLTAQTKRGENGVTLAREDGLARLSIFTSSNARQESPRAFLRRNFPFDRTRLGYDRVASNFFAVSMRREGKIFYTRCNFASAIHCIEFEYPGAEKRQWDGIVTRVSRSLRPLG